MSSPSEQQRHPLSSSSETATTGASTAGTTKSSASDMMDPSSHDLASSSTSSTTTAPDKQNRSNTSTLMTITDTVYIGNVPLKYATETVMEKLLQPYGQVQRVSVHQRASPAQQQQNSNQHKRRSNAATAFCFCQLQSTVQAAAAIRALHGRPLAGQRLVVQPAHDNNSHKGSSSMGQAAAAAATTATISLASRHQQTRQLDSRIQAIQKKLQHHQEEHGVQKR